MKRIPNARTVLIAGVCLAIAGCGGATAAPPAKTPATKTAKPTPRPTKVTPELTSYAQLIEPVVRSGITQATTLLKTMARTSTSDLGRTCVTAGGDLSSNRDAFTSVPAPASAKKFYGAAKHAYSITLSATDECGIASDSNSPKAMAASAKDLRGGLGELNRIRGTLAGWAARH